MNVDSGAGQVNYCTQTVPATVSRLPEYIKGAPLWRGLELKEYTSLLKIP